MTLQPSEHLCQEEPIFRLGKLGIDEIPQSIDVVFRVEGGRVSGRLEPGHQLFIVCLRIEYKSTWSLVRFGEPPLGDIIEKGG